tara:strand:+ start:239 stop:508 length:270 start_codon:yes stop_codon:yes gene_type:complete
MKVKIDNIGEFEVKDLTYAEARTLHKKNTLIFWGKTEKDIDPMKYYQFLDEIKEISGISDEELKKYSMVEVDNILQTILMEYTGLNPKK